MTSAKQSTRRLSINKLRREIRNIYFNNVEETQGSFMKTLLVKVLETKKESYSLPAHSVVL